MKDCEIFLTIINEFKKALAFTYIFPMSWDKVEIQLKIVERR